MATRNTILGTTRLQKISKRPYTGPKKLALGPNPDVRVSEASLTSGPKISAPKATESRLTPLPENGTPDRSSKVSEAPGTPSTASSLNEVTEIDFAELKDGNLVELVEDPANPGHTLLAVWKGGKTQFLDRLEQDGRVLISLARNNEVLRHIRLPSDAKPYDSVQELLRRLETLISQCVAVDEQHVAILADFVLSTWVIDRFSVAPYLSVVGLPQTGKTTLLRVLSLVCRRPLLIADITSASFYHACARFMPTMLIDEAGSIKNNRTLRHMLRSGTTRDVLAVRKNRAFHCYGAKVISSLEPPDDAALNSRCIVIPMSESKSTALVRTDEPAVQQQAADLQAQLLRFRFENYKTVRPVPVPGDEALRPRTRDLLRVLSAAHADVSRSELLLRFVESGQGVQLEPLSPEQNAVVRALFSAVHIREDFSRIWISDLTQRVNTFLELAGEQLRIQPRKVGAVVTSLGFSSRTRTNSGWVISLSRKDAERLHELAVSYGIDGIRDSFPQGISPDECSLCLAVGLDKKEPGPKEGMNRIQNTLQGIIKTRIRHLSVADEIH